MKSNINQNRIKLILYAFFLTITLSNYAQKDKIDAYVEKITKKFEIPGTALAVIHKGEVIYKNYSGLSNLESATPITEKSLFRLHSLSKIFVSTKIFQWIEEGKISLEDTISKYLKDLPETWRAIRIKHLLSHSSGLPNVIALKDTSTEDKLKAIYNKEIIFTNGELSDYNQTNFWLLNRIIREISKESFSQTVLKSQFDLSQDKVIFSSVTDITPNRISEYKPNRKGELQNFYFKVPKYMFGAAGLTISLDEFIKWNNQFDTNQLVSSKSKTEIFTPFQYKKGTGFTIGGWDVQNINEYKSYGFNGGGLVNFRKYPTQDLSIIWLTNGYRIPYNIDAVTNEIAGIIDADLIDKTPTAAKILTKSFQQKEEKEAIQDFYKLKKEYPFVNFENVLNGLGYDFLSHKEIAKAITVFTLTTSEYPNSANAFDSLAEAYFEDKNYDLSLKNYQKAVTLGGTRGNAKYMIEKIKKIVKG